MKTSRYKIVIVRWKDSAISDRVLDRDTATNLGWLELVDVGHLIKDDKEELVLALEYGPEYDTYRHTLVIPQICVLSKVFRTVVIKHE